MSVPIQLSCRESRRLLICCVAKLASRLVRFAKVSTIFVQLLLESSGSV